MTHGWPGSVRRVPRGDRAADRPGRPRRRRAATPSTSSARRCPGYGFSDKPTATGLGRRAIAAAWAELMARLGYERYGAQGGDWGAGGRRRRWPRDADHVLGIHLNMLRRGAAISGSGPRTTERWTLERRDEYSRRDRATRASSPPGPRPLGYGLADSPAGQCAWIVEKFWSWSDCDGHPENVLTPRRAARQRDALLAARRRRLLGAPLLGDRPRPRPDHPGRRPLRAQRLPPRHQPGPRALDPRPGAIPPTTTCSTGAAISPRWKSRISSRARSAPPSA